MESEHCTTAGYRPVSPANRFDRDSHRHLIVHDEARARESINVVLAEARLAGEGTMTIGGGVSTPTPEGLQQLARAATHPNADDLLALIGTADTLTWDTQWKAMEIIREAVGGKKALLATGWVTDTELDEFGYAANNPPASGDAARHARRPPTTAPARIMTIEEGQQLIRDLARQWLNSLP
jgi:hypothetical protein